MSTVDRSRVFRNIADCSDPKKLRKYMANAKARRADDVYDAAFHRLIAVQPTAQIGSIAYDVWRTVHAFEELLTEERDRTTRLQRTRQAIARKGEVRTVVDLVLKPNASEGFKMLNDRELQHLSFEALVIARHEDFPAQVVDKAVARLESAGMDLDTARRYWAGNPAGKVASAV